VAAEGDSVVVCVHITARGKISGAEVDLRFYAHAKLRDDKVVYIFDHGDKAAALEPSACRSKTLTPTRSNLSYLRRGHRTDRLFGPML
jgi:hypothetical protein